MSSSPPLLHIAGPSGSGKTALTEKLIARLTADGYRVGAIKRTHHDVVWDTPGKDSHRFAEAGAVVTMLASDTFVGTVERPKTPPSIAELAAVFVGKADIVVVESYRTSRSLVTARLAFVAADEGEDPEADGLIYTGPTPDGADRRPRFSRDEIDRIADWIGAAVMNG